MSDGLESAHTGNPGYPGGPGGPAGPDGPGGPCELSAHMFRTTLHMTNAHLLAIMRIWIELFVQVVCIHVCG